MAPLRTQFVVEVQLKRHEVPSFDVYPFSLPVVRRMESLEMHPHVTFIVGENGSGKSTLLEAFLSLLCDRFRRNGLYILDEPEAALSPTRQLAAVARIHDLVEQGCQFIVATHSPIIMAYPNAQILWIGEDGVIPIDYMDTEHYQVTKQFMENHEAMLRVLMQGDDC